MPRPSNTEERREQIVRALFAVMAERGYDGASVSEVAKAARLSSGLVHYHFADKQEILLGLIDSLWREAVARIEQRRGGRTVDDIVDALLATGDAAEPAVVRCWVAIAAEAMRQKKVARRYGEVLEALAARLEEASALALREETGSSQGARRAATGVLAAIQGYFVLSAAAPSLVAPGSAAGTVKQMARGLWAKGRAR